MNWFQRIARFISRLVGLQLRAPRLEANGPLTVPVIVGQLRQDAAPVLVVDGATGEPLSSTTVRYRVLEGPMAIGPQKTNEVMVNTDADGFATVAAQMTSRGNGLLAAELAEGGDPPLVFILRTEGMVHVLNLYGPPSYPSDPGHVTVTIAALDHQSRPVSGAELLFEGHVHGDHVEQGAVAEIRGGLYEGAFDTHLAGEWVLAAQDRATHVVGRRCVHVLPGPPDRIDLLEKPDPRREPPYDRAVARARLADVHGNSLDPRRLVGKVGDAPVERWIVGKEAWFPIQFAGHGMIDLVMADHEGTSSLVVPVTFAGIWLVSPSTVEPGTSFLTEVRAVPTPGGALSKASIQISFDPERVAYVQLRPVEGSEAPLTTSAALQGSRVTIDVSSGVEITAQDWPQGVPVCAVEWSCLGEGTACFDVEGSMSPAVDGWTLCVEQKSRRENVGCVCVNVIYRTWRNEDRRTGRLMVNQAVSVISSNTYLCCPVLIYDWHICALNGAQWVQIMRLWGGKQEPETDAEVDALLDAPNLCKQENCINLYVLPIGDPSLLGRSRIGPPGSMIITPVGDSGQTTLAAHEFGHALGLRHVNDGYNLMDEGNIRGHYLSRAQCETIWRTLGNYPCD
jgi:hypothetical protein